MGRPRILYVVHGFPPEAIGGTELHTSWLAHELSSKFEIFVFTRTLDPSLGEYEVRNEEVSGIKVRRVKVSDRFWVDPSDHYLSSKVDDLFASYLDEVRPAVVHVQHTVGLSAGIIEIAVSQRIPVILQLRDFFYMCERVMLWDVDDKLCDGPLDGRKCANCIKEDSTPYIPKQLASLYSPVFEQAGIDRADYMRRLLLLPDIILCPSRFVKEKFVEFGIPARKIRISPTGVRFAPQSRSKELGRNKVVFGFLGNVYRHKGVDVLIDAFGKLDQSKAELRIYGSTGDPTFLDKYRTASANMNVKFFDRYSNEELPEILSHLDVVVHPSICHESYSLVIREAFAAGVPVIVSDIRAQKDAVEDGKNGLHFRAEDAVDLSLKMNLLIEKPSLLHQLAQGIPRVRTIEDQAREIAILYRSIVRGKKRRMGENRILDELSKLRERIRSRSLEQVLRPSIVTMQNAVNPANAHDPLIALLLLYESRSDLQAAFPEVAHGEYLRFFIWARDSLGTMNDSSSNLMTRQLAWYRDNSILNLHDENEKQREGIADIQVRLKRIEDEKAKVQSALNEKAKVESELLNQLNQANSELNQANSELRILNSQRDDLRSELNRTQREIQGIKQSFGFRVIRFYGSRIDHYFPNGTRRGEFKAIVVQSSRIMAGQGITVFLRLAGQKLRRREFRIVRPLPSQKYTEQSIRVAADSAKASLAVVPETRIHAACDSPQLSPNSVAKVSESIVVSGWAVSEAGIKRVDVYLDETHLGPASYGASRPDVRTAYPQFPDSQLSGFRKMVNIEGNARKGSHLLKIVVESNDQSTMVLEGVIEVGENIRQIEETLNLRTREELSIPRPSIEMNSSVVILTKTPPADFNQTIELLREQDLSPQPEIIIINSGNTNLSGIAEKYNLTVLNIPSEEFGHGRTRNYGLAQSRGDYIFFITDDAIPAGKNLLSDMIRVLGSDAAVVAVTARQVPRTDADLMACQAMWGHYKALGLDRDRIVSSKDFDDLTTVEKRRLCQLDDVCACYRRDTLLRYRFSEELGYAEDLELGVRFIKAGFKVAQLYSRGVIHSHNRSSTYHLKRYYLDAKTLPGLLDYDMADFAKLSQSNFRSLDDLLDCILYLYDSVCLATDELREHCFPNGEISLAFRAFKRALESQSRPKGATHGGDSDLANFLTEIVNITGHTRSMKLHSNPLTKRYLMSLVVFEEWLVNTHESLEGLQEEFMDTLYKILGAAIGESLGQYYLLFRTIEPDAHRLGKLDLFLSRDV